MRVCMIGTGYVGLVTGACLAEMGNHVWCVDVDQDKIARLNAGEVPIYEPGLEDIIKRNVSQGRLQFTTDTGEAVTSSLFVFIAVGTPPDGNGDAKSTVSVGTLKYCQKTLITNKQARSNLNPVPHPTRL